MIRAVWSAALLLTVAAGCNRSEDGIQAYQAPKEPAKPVQTVSHTPSAAKPPVASGVPKWDVPEGWTEKPAGEMRAAAYSVSKDDPSAEMTVIPLPVSPLLANVNRWAGQVSAKAVTEAELDKVVQHLDTPAGHVDWVDLTGQDGKLKMLAAVLEHEGANWYFKLAGPSKTVEDQKANFEKLVKSLRIEGKSAPKAKPEAADAAATPEKPATPAAAAPAAPAAPAAGTPSDAPAGPIAKWVTPAGWRREQSGGFRVLSFKAGDAAAPADVSVIPLPAASFGTAEAQVNRWRGQVGLPPVEKVNEADGIPVKISGADARVFDLAGPQQRIVVAWVIRGDQAWYYKMTGPAGTVGAQKEAFVAFLSSVEFGK